MLKHAALFSLPLSAITQFTQNTKTRQTRRDNITGIRSCTFPVSHPDIRF